MDWFTPERRKAIYTLVVSLVGILTVYGVVSQEQAAEWMKVAESVMTILALLLARANVNV